MINNAPTKIEYIEKINKRSGKKSLNIYPYSFFR